MGPGYQLGRIPWGLVTSRAGSHGAWLPCPMGFVESHGARLPVGLDAMGPSYQLVGSHRAWLPAEQDHMAPCCQWDRIPWGLITSGGGSHRVWLPVGQNPMGPGYRGASSCVLKLLHFIFAFFIPFLARFGYPKIYEQ